MRRSGGIAGGAQSQSEAELWYISEIAFAVEASVQRAIHAGESVIATGPRQCIALHCTHFAEKRRPRVLHVFSITRRVELCRTQDIQRL